MSEPRAETQAEGGPKDTTQKITKKSLELNMDRLRDLISNFQRLKSIPPEKMDSREWVEYHMLGAMLQEARAAITLGMMGTRGEK